MGATGKFDPSTCPSNSVIGTFAISSPVFSQPLTGTLFAVNKSPLPGFGYDIEAPGVSIKGYGVLSTPLVDPTCDVATSPVNYCPDQAQFTFYTPALPVMQAKLTLAAPASHQPLDTNMLIIQPSTYYCASPNMTNLAVSLLRGAPSVSANFSMGIYSCAAGDPPDTTITSSWMSVPTNSAQPAFQFAGTAGTTGFDCSIDTAAYAPCASGWTPSASLSNGSHTFRVRAANAYGPDPTPSSTPFTVDTVAPLPPVISSPSEGALITTTPTLVSFSGEQGATFSCAVDGGQYSSCSSPFSTGLLSNGNHSVSVKQRDAASNDSAAAVRNFSVQSPLTLTQSIAPSSTAAASHPDLVLSSNLPGSPDLASLKYALPAGLAIAPAAVASPCSTSAATAGTCPATSKIGTVSIAASGGVSAAGDVFLTVPTSSTYSAGIAVKATATGGLGNVIFQGGVSFDLNGSTQQVESLTFPSIPSSTSSSAALHITQLSLTLLGSTGAPNNPLVTNPSACPTTSASAITTANGVGGSVAQAITPYPVTACSSVPASTTLDASFTDPTAGHLTNGTFTISMPLGSSAMSVFSVKSGPSVTLYLQSLGGQSSMCPAVSFVQKFDPSTCPAQAAVGTFSITSPLFAQPLAGTLYAVNQSPIPGLGFDIQGPGVSIRGMGGTGTPLSDPTCDPATSPLGYCPQQVQFSLRMPAIPVTQAKLTFAPPASHQPLNTNILTVHPQPDCVSPSSASSTLTLLRGAPTVGATKSLTFAGC